MNTASTAPAIADTESASGHFIRQIIAEDVRQGRTGGVVTRFPPEPNGYLHVGHAKAICLDFGMADAFGGQCNLRMDDTNPAKESMEYVDAIRQDVRWLGFDWGERFYYSADYFERMFGVAQDLIRAGKAYVCELSAEEFKDCRGVPTSPGRPSPWRDRQVAESLDRFTRMRAGEFADGSLCLRAKIDMASPNLHMRDPVIYRIMRAHHYRVGDAWCIYPTYDFAHPLEDVFEGVTHSLCTLEFEVHRPLYDWVVEQVETAVRPRQIEFARLNLTYTVMSKRKLLELVQQGRVAGWDDPRMPTLCGMRRRGYPPEAVRTFCDTVGVTKYESLTDVALLEHCVREVLNRTVPRRMAVLKPLKLVLENIPEGEERAVQLVNNPEDEAAGTRTVACSRELLIEQDDFMEAPPKKFFRLSPGNAVRLRGAGFVACTGVDKHPVTGAIEAVRGEWFPPTDARKVKATIHWVSAAHACPVEVRLYDRLFGVPDPEGDKDTDYRDHLNPQSHKLTTGYVEPALTAAVPGERFQFERLGYFCVDSKDSRDGAPVFNQTVALRDEWAKMSGAR